VKKLAYLAGAAGIALPTVALMLMSRPSRAADHNDSTSIAANKAADITDVYAWMTADHTKVNLVMDVGFNVQGTDNFGTDLLYVLHVRSMAAYNAPTSVPTNIICKFASQVSVECWVGNAEYVKGDPSTMVSSTDGKVKVFAGKRNDPFFFNISGFKSVVAAVEAATLPTDDGHGCYNLGATGPVLAGLLAKGENGGAAKDDFAGLNVNALVIQVDASLLTGGGPILGVWGSTNMIGS